jgi:hypothetical protein
MRGVGDINLNARCPVSPRSSLLDPARLVMGSLTIPAWFKQHGSGTSMGVCR